MADCLAGRLGAPFRAALAVPRAGRHRGGDRRPPQAIGDDRLQQQAPGHGRAGLLHARLLGAARALVHDRPEERAGAGLRHVPDERGCKVVQRQSGRADVPLRRRMPCPRPASLRPARHRGAHRLGHAPRSPTTAPATRSPTASPRPATGSPAAPSCRTRSRPSGRRCRPGSPIRRIDVVITTGGTGFTGRDVTPEAIEPLFEKRMDGFSAIFHRISLRQDRHLDAAVARDRRASRARPTSSCCRARPAPARTPGTASWRRQLDYRHRPCNFVEIMPRLDEHLKRGKSQP